MITARRLAFLVGVTLVVTGLTVVFAPEFARGIDVTRQLLTVAAIVALLGGGLAIWVRLTAAETRIETPTPERHQAHPTPGDGFDEKLAALTLRDSVGGMGERREIRDRLDELAVAILVRHGESENGAREALARGSWTDDPHAAAFFAEARATEVPLEDRLHMAFSAEPNNRKRARHAIDALADIADTERER